MILVADFINVSTRCRPCRETSALKLTLRYINFSVVAIFPLCAFIRQIVFYLRVTFVCHIYAVHNLGAYSPS
jgi:hypothetical protein